MYLCTLCLCIVLRWQVPQTGMQTLSTQTASATRIARLLVALERLWSAAALVSKPNWCHQFYGVLYMYDALQAGKLPYVSEYARCTAHMTLIW
jgi:hypothetical protein